MSMRELFRPDPLAGFEKMAGFQNFFCLIIKRFHSYLERTSNLSSKVASCSYNLLEEHLIAKLTSTTLISLRCTGNVHA